jgi:hypothetical protein
MRASAALLGRELARMVGRQVIGHIAALDRLSSHAVICVGMDPRRRTAPIDTQTALGGEGLAIDEAFVFG